MSELHMLVRIVAKSESIDTVAAAMKVAQSHSLKEEGVIAYQFYQDIKEPTHFYVQEHYRDKQALKDHGTSEHMAAYLRTVDGLLESVHMHKVAPV